MFQFIKNLPENEEIIMLSIYELMATKTIPADRNMRNYNTIFNKGCIMLPAINYLQRQIIIGQISRDSFSGSSVFA